MFDSVLMFESPVQIMIVLLIALIVFGPKRLPEIGKQIGTALRELKKAGNDVVQSFNVDHEPDPAPYRYDTSPDYNTSYAYSAPAISGPTDLTDYTIAGIPPKDKPAYEYSYPAYDVAAEAGAAAETSGAPETSEGAHGVVSAEGIVARGGEPTMPEAPAPVGASEAGSHVAVKGSEQHV